MSSPNRKDWVANAFPSFGRDLSPPPEMEKRRRTKVFSDAKTLPRSRGEVRWTPTRAPGVRVGARDIFFLAKVK